MTGHGSTDRGPVRVKGRVRAVSPQRGAKIRRKSPHSGRNWGGAATVRPPGLHEQDLRDERTVEEAPRERLHGHPHCGSCTPERLHLAEQDFTATYRRQQRPRRSRRSR